MFTTIESNSDAAYLESSIATSQFMQKLAVVNLAPRIPACANVVPSSRLAIPNSLTELDALHSVRNEDFFVLLNIYNFVRKRSQTTFETKIYIFFWIIL